MKPYDLTTDEEKQMILQAFDACNKVRKFLRKFVDGGLPFNEHLSKADEQYEMLDKTISLLEIPRK